jgi:hypothetical protein
MVQVDDEVVQAALVRRLLELHPARLTAAELLREMAGEHASFAESDAIERALGDLEGAGLLHRGDDFVTPSRAALHLSELLDR